MKLLIVLCLGTLALSAPASKKVNQIDFKRDYEETQDSVRSVEVNTFKPKVTATKKSAQVFEDDKVAPGSSSLNLEQDESDISEPSARANKTGNDDLENEHKTEFIVTGSTDSVVTDTKIGEYDEDKVNGTTGKGERSKQEQDQDQEQTRMNRIDQNAVIDDSDQYNKTESSVTGSTDTTIRDNDEDKVNENTEKEERSEQAQDQDQEQVRINQINQNAVIDDSYQYDDESLEREMDSAEGPKQPSTTTESNSDKPAINGDPKLNHETQVVEKGSSEIQDRKTPVTNSVQSGNHDNTDKDIWSTALFYLVQSQKEISNHGSNHLFTGLFPIKQLRNSQTGMDLRGSQTEHIWFGQSPSQGLKFDDKSKATFLDNAFLREET